MRKSVAALLLLAPFVVSAETLTLDQAIERALSADPRIEERQHLVAAARGLLQEVEGNGDWFVDANAFVGLAPQASGNIFENGACTAAQCNLRDDRYDIDGLTGWFNLQMGLIKPLYSFGKFENYLAAAKANIEIKGGDVRLQRVATVLDVKKAYYGYLAARDARLLLGDVDKRIQSAIELVSGWLEDGGGDAKQSDLYALQAGQALLGKYRAQAVALEKIALAGLKVVTGVGLDADIEVADQRLEPVALPELSLAELKQQALSDRPEMQQLEAGLKARRSLVEASKAGNRPNLYAGLVGMVSYAPGRDRLNNPFISDPFNDAGITPVVGVKWDWKGGVQRGKTASAQAELDALISKSDLARMGIPYQVAEQYYQVQGYHESVEKLAEASRSSRRWMIASYTDFEAGLEKADKVMTAFQAYVVASSDYIQTTFDYNMHVAQLESATGVRQ
ncbi:MAG: TolC family protein [Pseudomonadota bacterium]|nr:TolC family protein [Pseudomonadota bacterium]